MSDAPSTTIETFDTTSSAGAVENSEVAEVLMEQVDAKVSAIEKAQTGLQPYQAALVTAQADLTRLQSAVQAAADPDVKSVYQRAIQVAMELVSEIKKGGEGMVGKIKLLQEELRDLLAQLAEKDPQNPLIKEM